MDQKRKHFKIYMLNNKRYSQKLRHQKDCLDYKIHAYRDCYKRNFNFSSDPSCNREKCLIYKLPFKFLSLKWSSNWQKLAYTVHLYSVQGAQLTFEIFLENIEYSNIPFLTRF